VWRAIVGEYRNAVGIADQEPHIGTCIPGERDGDIASRQGRRCIGCARTTRCRCNRGVRRIVGSCSSTGDGQRVLPLSPAILQSEVGGNNDITSRRKCLVSDLRISRIVICVVIAGNKLTISTKQCKEGVKTTASGCVQTNGHSLIGLCHLESPGVSRVI